MVFSVVKVLVIFSCYFISLSLYVPLSKSLLLLMMMMMMMMMMRCIYVCMFDCCVCVFILEKKEYKKRIEKIMEENIIFGLRHLT